MRKATGSSRTYSIPGKTTALVPEFAVEDLPSAELQPRFLHFSKGPALGQNTLVMMMMMGEKHMIFREVHNYCTEGQGRI